MNWQPADRGQEDFISHFVLGADDASVFSVTRILEEKIMALGKDKLPSLNA